MYIRIYIHTYMYMCMHGCIHIYTHICIHTHSHIYTYIYLVHIAVNTFLYTVIYQYITHFIRKKKRFYKGLISDRPHIRQGVGSRGCFLLLLTSHTQTTGPQFGPLCTHHQVRQLSWKSTIILEINNYPGNQQLSWKSTIILEIDNYPGNRCYVLVHNSWLTSAYYDIYIIIS